MEAIKVKSFREDYKTLSKRLLAVNGYHAESSYNPHNVKAYVIHNEYSVICIAVGSGLQEALDNAVDNGCLDSCKIDDLLEYDYNQVALDEYCSLGNASELFDLTYIGVSEEVTPYK